VARFAFDRPVLPVDVNVRRVLDRTKGSFGPASAHALMDLGATVCLARIPRCAECPLAHDCPSRGRRYEPLRKQGRFEGSFRQRRARTLTLVAERARRRSSLDDDAVAALAADGLVEVRRGLVSLPR
jgi:A/G-specific adenine glycosylase